MASRLWFGSIDSTQTRAIALAHEGSEPGTRVVADRQEHGVGRSDHTWSSPPGGLYLSMIVPRPPTGRESLAALAIGAELRRAVATQYGVGTVLCWPNDLLVPGHRSPPGKLAGILLDQVFSIEHGAALVAGIGLNVRPDRSQFPPGLRERVATLAELSPPGPTVRDAEELAASAAMSGIARLQTSDGARGVIDECRQALYGRGRRASVDGMPAGRIRELGDDGTLWLDGVAGAVPVRAGSLSIEEPS